ncbi:type III pantothenate kinase [Alkalimarinus alittae]|uniref:Type III pantothenate kinase n=1 Tax=Alkalimarinus alittae TaxID=2961619 RepID=A0ABY6N168_9ALTE|nr:type III pantothenate kinase [Alkalimarinus alittae]UZE95847.1 type III pantothenate kinase [Alkalimarinus alittae]
MNLQIDIGNSYLKWRIVDNDTIISRGREATSANLTLNGLANWGNIRSVSISSVAADCVERRLREVLSVKLPSLVPYFAKSQSALRGVVNAYKEPASLGVDRWLAIVAGYSRCKDSCYIVDCGSAITVDVVDSHGRHKGGYILPGLRLMRQSLSAGTERVEFNDLEGVGDKHGITTSECVRSGVNFVLLSIFDRLRTKMKEEGIKRLIVTGGDGVHVKSFGEHVEYYPDLVLEGLALARGISNA